MQWGQIKTLFILSFLVLNIFLLMQFIDKQREANISVLEQTESTIEDILRSESITIVPDLPEGDYREPFISARQFVFTDDLVEAAEQKHNQQISVINRHLLLSILEEPIAFPGELSELTVDYVNMVKDDLVLFPEEYTFWDWNEEFNVLIFFQTKDDKPFYYNQSGLILMFLEDDDIIFYIQTKLIDSDNTQEETPLIKPIKAIETLYVANELHLGDEITNVDIGFHTRIPLRDGLQVFVPVWKVTVNDHRDYYINAIEGHIFSSNETEFLEETIELEIERIEAVEERTETHSILLELLNERLRETK